MRIGQCLSRKYVLLHKNFISLMYNINGKWLANESSGVFGKQNLVWFT